MSLSIRKSSAFDYDAVVVGAGVAGLYALYKLREIGLTARAFESGNDVGGVWYWKRNAVLGDGEMREIRQGYSRIFEQCRRSYGGFIHTFDPRSGLEVSAEERQETFETLWGKPGFAFWFGNFRDLLMDETVNASACEFIRERIRERVRDPNIARKLMPDHPFGTKRVPLENGYYEVYNLDSAA